MSQFPVNKVTDGDKWAELNSQDPLAEPQIQKETHETVTQKVSDSKTKG